jgi:hypothetical protein
LSNKRGRRVELAGFLFFCGSPNRVELLDKLIRIGLGFALGRKGIEGFVTNLLIVINIPAEAIGIPNIFYDVGGEYGTVCHSPTVLLCRLFGKENFLCGHKNWLTDQFHSLKTRKSLVVNTIEAVGDEPGSSRTIGDHMPNQAHTKAAEHHESAAKAHRAAAEFHGKNDHLKGNEHAAEAQKHSKVASGASDAAQAKSSSRM